MGISKELIFGGKKVSLENKEDTNNIKNIEISKMVDFRLGQPFSLYTEEKIQQMKESISRNGILSPIIVRQIEEDKYEIIAGHNRVKCARELDIKTVPTVEDVIEDDSFIEKKTKPKAPTGYKWVCGAKKKDIEWDIMKKLERREAIKNYYRYKEILETENAEDNSLMYIQDDKLFYWGSVIFQKGESMRDFFIRNGMWNRKYYIDCYACVSQDHRWSSKGKMGMWAISYDEMDGEEWHKQVEKILTKADDEQYIIFVDCHI